MMCKPLNDQQLVQLYIAGKESAISELLTRHKNKIFTNIFMMVKDHKLSEDIFQDTFIKVINTLRSGNYNEEGKFLPWVLRIAHNLVIDYFRKNNKIRKVRGGKSEEDEFDIFLTIKDESPSVEEAMVTEQIHSDVKQLLEHLPREQKQIVIMRHFVGMSFKDISESLDISINTALGRMRYALINLRKLANEKNIVLTR